MKFKYKKGCDARQVFQFLAEYIDQKEYKYPILKEDLEIEFFLCDENGNISKNDENIICVQNDELKNFKKNLEDSYKKDALTGLYNRSKYEQDIHMLQTIGYTKLICVYLDVVGLHEINNRLGHKAGDEMLCLISDGLRKIFPDESLYRIGGDEFVIFCQHCEIEEAKYKISDFKSEVKKYEYEISAGIAESLASETLDETINDAENRMRYDKTDFYRNNGGKRQIRSLNTKLEKLLLEKEDASHFLTAIAPKYKGVYMVNPNKDTCRYIYVPPYFQKMLDRNNGAFLPSMKDYCDLLVCDEYYNQFIKILDYKFVGSTMEKNKSLNFIYQKKDGNTVKLKITKYDSSSYEQLWIFSDETSVETKAV